MEQESVVGTLSADIAGESITAHYFVENGVIHANIAGRTLLSPVGNCSPRDTVRALLTSYVLQRSRRNEGRDAQPV
jgi:hypothetical protein